MPFDATPVDSEVVTVLRKARALIDSPEKIVCGNFDELVGHCTYAAIAAAADAPITYDAQWRLRSHNHGPTLDVCAVFMGANGIRVPARDAMPLTLAKWHDTQAWAVKKDMARLCPILMEAFDKAIILAGGTP